MVVDPLEAEVQQLDAELRHVFVSVFHHQLCQLRAALRERHQLGFAVQHLIINDNALPLMGADDFLEIVCCYNVPRRAVENVIESQLGKILVLQILVTLLMYYHPLEL